MLIDTQRIEDFLKTHNCHIINKEQALEDKVTYADFVTNRYESVFKQLQTDIEVERAYDALEDVLFIENKDGNLVLAKPYEFTINEKIYSYESGTPREPIWEDMFKLHSKGAEFTYSTEIEDIEDFNSNKFNAIIEVGEGIEDISDIINIIDNLDDYNLIIANNEEELGISILDTNDEMQNIPDWLSNYIDYESYGRDYSINTGAVLTSEGYIYSFNCSKEYYKGIEDIPEECFIIGSKQPIEEKTDEIELDV